jgi:hypothetical protein
VLDDHYEEKIDDAGIHYVPFQPDVYRQIEREYDGD